MPNCESVSLNDRPPRKSRIEHNWSGLAQGADLTADMLNRQQRADSVAKVVLRKVSIILRAAGAVFV